MVGNVFYLFEAKAWFKVCLFVYWVEV